MKKLTAGIFAGILTIVTVNAANADIATTNYVKGAIESLDGNVDGTTGIVKTISQTDGKITATRDLITSDDVDAISQEKVTGLTGALNAKQTKDNIVNAAADGKFAAGDYDSTTKYPSMKAAQQIAALATAEQFSDVVSDITALQDKVDGLADTDPEAEGSIANSIATAIAGLDGTVTGTGVVKEISQTDGKVTATLSAVSKNDLDADLSADIDAKMATSAYNTATTMAADGAYAKKESSVGANLTALDTQVKKNADAISELAGEGEGSVKKQIETLTTEIKETTDSLQGSIDDLDKKKANAADVYTKTEIDGKVNEINESIDGKVTAIDLNKKLLTTNTDGQLVDAATGLTQPSECSDPDVTCMLINDGTVFKWEKVVDKYTPSAN